MNKELAKALEIVRKNRQDEQMEEATDRVRAIMALSKSGMAISLELALRPDIVEAMIAFAGTIYQVGWEEHQEKMESMGIKNPKAFIQETLRNPHCIPLMYSMIPLILALADEGAAFVPPAGETPAKAD